MNARHDARAFFWLTALTGATFVTLVLWAGAAFGAGVEKSPVVERWNQFCASIERENETLRELNDSLHALHPDRAVDARRMELYTRAIIEHERQTILLRAMRRAEFGNAAGEQTETKSAAKPAVAF